MGTSGGPNIKKDGLVLKLDATNSKSFRGEPTVNLKTNIQISNYSTGQYVYHGLEQTGEFKGWYKLTATSTSVNRLIMAVIGINVLANTTHTVSLEWVSPNNSLSFELNGTGGFGVVSDKIGNTNRLFKTFTPTVNGGYNLYLRSANGEIGSIQNGVLYFRNIQWEEKPYATPFVNGTRGATVGGGGGWSDLSRNNNNVELINGPIHKKIERGYISLDGVNDRLIIDKQLTNSTQCTVIIWLATTDTQFLWAVGNTTSFYFGASIGGGTFYHENSGSPTYYIDTNQVLNPVGYLDGKFHMFEAKGVNLSTWTKFGILHYAGGAWDMNGKVAMVQVYDRILTAEESMQNYNSNKSRFI
jgi:hypothetical protein